MTTTTKQIPEWAKTDAVDYDPSLIIRFQFDGSDGLFKCGDREFDSLTMQPLAYRQHNSERWGRAKQSWLDIAFLDHDNDVCILSLNKQSNVEMSILFSKMLKDGIALQAVRLELTSKPVPIKLLREDDELISGSYHVVDPFEAYEFVSEPQFEKAISILEKFRWALVGEVA